MSQYPSLRRWLAAMSAMIVMGVVVVLAATAKRSPEQTPAPTGSDPNVYPWPMFGGSPSRNLVNLRDKNVATKWDVEDKTNILWVQDLGSKAYGGPAIGDGKILIGTNNEKAARPESRGRPRRHHVL